MAEPATFSSSPETNNPEQDLRGISDEVLHKELVRRGFSVVKSVASNDLPSNIVSLDEVRAKKAEEATPTESLATTVGRENFQRQVEQGMDPNFSVSPDVNDTLSSPLQLDRMVPQSPKETVATPIVPSVTPVDLTPSPKPSESEYTATLASAADALAPVQKTIQEADAVMAMNGNTKPTESEYTDKLASAADALAPLRDTIAPDNAVVTPSVLTPAVSQTDVLAKAAQDAEKWRQSLGQNYVSPNPVSTPQYSDKLASAADSVTKLRESLAMNNESVATSEPVTPVKTESTEDEEEKRRKIIVLAQEKAKNRLGWKTRVGFAIGAAVLGLSLVRDTKAPEAPISPLLTSQSAEAPAVPSTERVPYVLPTDTQPSGGEVISTQTPAESKPNVPPVVELSQNSQETGSGVTPLPDVTPAIPSTEEELPDAEMVEVKIDKPGDSISQSMSDEHQMPTTEFDKKYYEDPQIMTGIVLYNWNEFQEAWKGKEGYPTSLDEYMQLVVKADGGDQAAKAQLLEMTTHGADMVEQGQEYYIPATEQDGKEVYQELIQSYKENPQNFQHLLDEIEESKKEEEKLTEKASAPLVDTASTSMNTAGIPVTNTGTSPLGALANAAGSTTDSVSHEPIVPQTTSAEQPAPAIETAAANNAGIPTVEQPPVVATTPDVVKKKKFLGIF